MNIVERRTGVTAVFTHWKRPDNLRQIINQILTQTVKPRIYIWNNGGRFDCPEAAWHVESSFNTVTWARWFMASMADTEYVMVMDDDLLFTDERVVQDAIDFLKDGDENMIIGPCGVVLVEERTYKDCVHVRSAPGLDRRVDMLKGRLMIMRTKALERVHFVAGSGRHVLLGDDIRVSALTARGMRLFHCVPSLFYGRYEDMPCPHASCDASDHYQVREKVRREMFRPASKNMCIPGGRTLATLLKRITMGSRCGRR